MCGYPWVESGKGRLGDGGCNVGDRSWATKGYCHCDEVDVEAPAITGCDAITSIFLKRVLTLLS